jgi:hypothetical protein
MLLDAHHHQPGAIAIHLSHNCGFAVRGCRYAGLPLPA